MVVKFGTEYTEKVIRKELDEVKKLNAVRYPSIGISEYDDIELLEALRIYKKYIIKRNKREGF